MLNLFVFGNGESRRDFDINSLRKNKNNIIIGCNAFYRDFKPDILCAVDVPIQEEIITNCSYLKDIIFIRRHRKSNITKDIEIHVKHTVLKETLRGVEYKDVLKIYPDMGYASGPTSVYITLLHILPYHAFIDTVYLLGFDLYTLENGKVNSMYKDTNCYIESKRKGTKHGTSAKQLATCFNMFRDVNFKRVLDSGNINPPEFSGISNIKTISYKELENEL